MRSILTPVFLALSLLLAACNDSPVLAGGERNRSPGDALVMRAACTPPPSAVLQARAKRTLLGIEKTLELHFRNLENVDTTGYKYERATRALCLAPGVISGTQRPLDVAIAGDGFFSVRQANGETAYTRSGHFMLDAEGVLCVEPACRLQPEIVLPQDVMAIGIETDGDFTVVRARSTERSERLGKIRLTRFPNPEALRCVTRAIYVASPAAGTAMVGTPGSAGFGTLQQNFLEASNVERTREMVSIEMLSQRWRAIAQLADLETVLGICGPQGLAAFEAKERASARAVLKTEAPR